MTRKQNKEKKQTKRRGAEEKPVADSSPARLPNAVALLRKSVVHLLLHKKVFAGIAMVYFLLTLLLVKGAGASSGIAEFKGLMDELLQDDASQLAVGFTLYGFLVGNASAAAGEAAAVYQSVVLVLISLVLIWALRQTYAGAAVGVKESFYKSTYPLIPFVLVVMVISLQLIPLAVGSIVLGYWDLATSFFEQLVFAVMVFLLALLSLYWLTASTIALYIVSLPDMKPLQSLRSARDLVRGYRWSIMRKLLFLPFVFLIVSALITVPVILYLTPLAEWVFLVLSVLAVVIAHGYLYTLYRELL